MYVIFLAKVDKRYKVSYFHEMTKKKGGMLILHMFLILAHLEQDKLKWTGYGQPLNYGQHMDKKTGFVHTLSIRMFVVENTSSKNVTFFCEIRPDSVKKLIKG